jgi:hypothetical protein
MRPGGISLAGIRLGMGAIEYHRNDMLALDLPRQRRMP